MGSCLTTQSLGYPVSSKSMVDPVLVSQMVKNMSQFINQTSKTLAAINQEIIKSNRTLDKMALEFENMDILSNSEEKQLEELENRQQNEEDTLRMEVKLLSDDDEENLRLNNLKDLELTDPMLEAIRRKLGKLFPGIQFTSCPDLGNIIQHYHYPQTEKATEANFNSFYWDPQNLSINKDKKEISNNELVIDDLKFATPYQYPIKIKYGGGNHNVGGGWDECTDCPDYGKSTIYIIIEAPNCCTTQVCTTCSWICNTLSPKNDQICTCGSTTTGTTNGKTTTTEKNDKTSAAQAVSSGTTTESSETTETGSQTEGTEKVRVKNSIHSKTTKHNKGSEQNKNDASFESETTYLNEIAENPTSVHSGAK